MLRPGNVHRADGWDAVLLRVIDRLRDRGQPIVVRADAAFALPALYGALERQDVVYAFGLPVNQVLERTIADLLTRPRADPATPRWCGIGASSIRPRRGTGLDG
jgi:hypothetical protein